MLRVLIISGVVFLSLITIYAEVKNNEPMNETYTMIYTGSSLNYNIYANDSRTKFVIRVEKNMTMVSYLLSGELSEMAKGGDNLIETVNELIDDDSELLKKGLVEKLELSGNTFKNF